MGNPTTFPHIYATQDQSCYTNVGWNLLNFWMKGQSLESAGFGNLDGLVSLSRRRAEFLNCFDNVHSLDNFAEDDVLAVKPACHDLSHASESRAKGNQWSKGKNIHRKE